MQLSSSFVLNTELGVLRSYKEGDFVQLSSEMTFCKKLKLMKIGLLHCKKHFISLERKNFHVFETLLLKLHLATFLTEEEVFEHPWRRNLIICLVALNTELVFLEAIKKWFVQLSSKMTFSAKLKLMKICLLHCKKHFISLERNIFHVFEPLLLKLHLATFSRWGRSFWAYVASQLHHLH